MLLRRAFLAFIPQGMGTQLVAEQAMRRQDTQVRTAARLHNAAGLQSRGQAWAAAQHAPSGTHKPGPNCQPGTLADGLG
jgi:hypothetical protein